MMSGWENFLVAQVGASAALAGLLFVGVSLNLPKIIVGTSLPNRALQALTFLMTILILSSLLLMPGQPLSLAGAETLSVGITLWVLVLGLDIQNLRKTERQYRRFIVQNSVLNQVTVLAYILTGFAILGLGAGGLYGLALIAIFSYLKAVSDAWVLLIEINR
jgi:modulator of FtsH protease